MSPTVEFEAESLEVAQERFSASVKDLYDGTEELRPGEQRKHIFDFEDGLRLIVSKDQYPDPAGSVGIHVSASVVDDETCGLYARIRAAIEQNPQVPVTNAAASAIDKATHERFKLLSGFEGKFKMAQMSPNGVLHYNVPLAVWERG